MELRQNLVGFHTDRGVTNDRFWLGDEPVTTTPPPGDFDWIYEGCNDTKVCIGIPNDCIIQRECQLFGSVFDNNGDFEFELLGKSEK